MRITGSTCDGQGFNCKYANLQSRKSVTNQEGQVHKTLAATLQT